MTGEEPAGPASVGLPRTGLLLGAALFLVILFGCELDPDNRLVTRMAAVAALMAVWWIFEAITALVPVALYPCWRSLVA